MKIIASKGDYHLCLYEGGFWTVDMITESVGRTLRASVDKAAVEDYFNSLKV